MGPSIKGVFVAPRGIPCGKTWKDTSSKGREQNPTHSRAEEPCVSLSHFLADSTLTSRDVKEFVFASVNHNNDHDMWSMSQSMLGLLKHANFHI